MTPDWQSGDVALYCGDCLDVLPDLEGITSVCCDPPYGLGFMGKDWDHGVPGAHFWEAVSGACLPGAPLLAFGGTRTVHRLVCAIEDAGWEIRDRLQWIYGSGFPKSLDLSKAIGKAAGAEREVVGHSENQVGVGWADSGQARYKPDFDITTPATEAAQVWSGYGTALKPAHEPICLAMKPLSGMFAQNALEHGVAGLNVDGGRIPTLGETFSTPQNTPGNREGVVGAAWQASGNADSNQAAQRASIERTQTKGRWPANVIHDGSAEVVGLFPVTGGGGQPQQRARRSSPVQFGGASRPEYKPYADTATGGGSAARFFYCAKASRAERNMGCEGLPDADGAHPTVKPLALMRYLLTLVTMPQRNLVLDPFMGSGTTGVAAVLEGLPFVGIELDPGYFEIACRRIEAAQKGWQPTYDPDPEPPIAGQTDLFSESA